MTMSNIPKPEDVFPEGGFFKTGDVLKTKEQAIAFLKAVGWESFRYIRDNDLLEDSTGCGVCAYDIDNNSLLPFIIVGFLPAHTATVTTPNPPLVFEEAVRAPILYLDFRDLGIKDYDSGEQIVCMILSYERAKWTIEDALKIDLAVRRGKVYAHDPDEHPPTERSE